MARVSMSPATQRDADEMAPRVRAEDRDEVMEATGMVPAEVLSVGVEASAEAWVLRIDGEIACMWGVVQHPESSPGEMGMLWMLSTDTVDKYPKTFLRACRNTVSEIFDRWKMLYNAIDERYDKAIRWAERMGFPLEPGEPLHDGGPPFRWFLARKEDIPQWDSLH